MLMVIPRAISSGARSMPSKDTYRLAAGSRLASTFVIAAVSVVLPWSTWPMVPMLRCGLVRAKLVLGIMKLHSGLCWTPLNEGTRQDARCDDTLLRGPCHERKRV